MYDRSFFDTPIDRRHTACEKWDGLCEREGQALLPMWVADMDFRCPTEVSDALTQRAAHPVYGYTEVTKSSVEAMLSFMQRRHGLTLSADEQLLLPCVVTGLRVAVNALTEAGDKVIVQPPVYGPFYDSVRAAGRELAQSPLIADAQGHYQMDFDDVERKCREGAKLMLLCSPHNPVGRSWTESELRQLLQILSRYGVPLVSDEIHEDFVFAPGRFVPALSIATDAHAPVVALTAVSKTFNLAGLQQAVLFTRNQQIKQKMESVLHASGVTSGNLFALVATEAAYRHGDEWLDGMLAYLGEADALSRRELAARLPECIVSPLEATYLQWLDLRQYGLSTDELMQRTHAAGVALTPGTFFGKEIGEGFLRLNLACPHAQTLEAIKRLEKAIKA